MVAKDIPLKAIYPQIKVAPIRTIALLSVCWNARVLSIKNYPAAP